MICDNPFFGDFEVQHDSFLEYALERVSRAILWHSIAKALNPSTQMESDRSHLRLTELSHFPHRMAPRQVAITSQHFGRHPKSKGRSVDRRRSRRCGSSLTILDRKAKNEPSPSVTVEPFQFELVTLIRCCERF